MGKASLGIQLVCMWPGLAAAWYRGAKQDLVIAIACCWLASFMLMATFIWPSWLPVLLVRALWIAGILAWIVSTGMNHMRLPALLGSGDVGSDEEFQAAQEAYLRGNWFDAEAQLLEILQKAPRDAESWLLLVGVLRHTSRFQAAMRRLSQLPQRAASHRCQFEIQRERALIERDQAAMLAETQVSEEKTIEADDSIEESDQLSIKATAQK